ncbi:hypothetical protein [Aliikangiella sp. IMCC44359]|uniref:hypothetical protein n=1 Tax=Aliikangiella sp. IMCC44359 TaxID=3459125 RepID=UPI00403A9B02
MNANEIRHLLPHRYPFLMVDSVISLEEKVQCVGIKNVTLNEPCYRGVTDATEINDLRYPVSLQIESFAQVGALLCMKSRENIDVDVDNVMLAGSVLGVKIQQDVFPGDVLEHHVSIIKELADTVVIGGEIKVKKAGSKESLTAALVDSVLIAIRSSQSLFG